MAERDVLVRLTWDEAGDMLFAVRRAKAKSRHEREVLKALCEAIGEARLELTERVAKTMLAHLGDAS